jgi:hypothetical protein
MLPVERLSLPKCGLARPPEQGRVANVRSNIGVPPNVAPAAFQLDRGNYP